MADDDVSIELERAEMARRNLSNDLRRISQTAQAVARDGSRTARFVAWALVGTALLLGGAAALKRRRRLHDWQPPEEPPPLVAQLARTILLSAAGTLATHLARRWCLALPAPARRDVEITRH